MTASIRIDRNVPMEMRDGTILRGDIHRPDDNGKHPAILIRTPYNKLVSGHNDFLNPVNAAFAGYAVVLQDVRGRFASDGIYGGDIFKIEGPDGYDTVEWVASQPWCDGNVGMGGVSYMAVLEWIAAMESPPHLKALAPWMAGTSPLVENTLLDGVMLLHLWANWTPLMAVDIIDRMAKQGGDVTQMRQMIYRAIFNMDEVYNHLPLKDVPHYQFEGVKQIWQSRLASAIPGPELAGRARWQYEKIATPCLHVSGWYDIYTRSIFENFNNMKEKGGSDRARRGQHIIMGPWAHGAALPNFVGMMHFGMMGGAQGMLLSEHHITFYDKYLKGIDTPIPGIRYFVMGRNQWRVAESWPLPGTRWQKFFLHSGGLAHTSRGDGVLSRDEPSGESPDIFVYNPLFPVPSIGGRVVAGQSGFVAGPIDQSEIEKRPDVLCYATPELTEDMEVTGPLKLNLFASTSVKDTDFTAILIDVYPNGRAYNIADGIIRGRYRKSIFEPQMLNPGEVYRFSMSLGTTSYLFKKGHRIRLCVSSSNFPAFDRNMNTGNQIGEDAQGIPAMQTVYHQKEHPSYIELPVISS